MEENEYEKFMELLERDILPLFGVSRWELSPIVFVAAMVAYQNDKWDDFVKHIKGDTE